MSAREPEDAPSPLLFDEDQQTCRWVVITERCRRPVGIPPPERDEGAGLRRGVPCRPDMPRLTADLGNTRLVVAALHLWNHRDGHTDFGCIRLERTELHEATLAPSVHLIGMEQRSTPRTEPMHVWYVAGGLLVASVLLGPYVRFESLIGLDAGIIPALMFAGALVLFAIGSDRSTSVTARRPLGTIALIALAVWTLISTFVSGAATVPPATETFLSFGYIDLIVQFILALIAATQIARAGAVPRPANLAPLWGVAATAASWIIQQVVTVAAGSNVTLFVPFLVILDSLVRVAGPVLLGILAIAIASRATAPRAAAPTPSGAG